MVMVIQTSIARYTNFNLIKHVMFFPKYKLAITIMYPMCMASPFQYTPSVHSYAFPIILYTPKDSKIMHYPVDINV